MSHDGQVLAGDGSHLSCVRASSSVAMNHHGQVLAGDGSHLSGGSGAVVVAFAFYNVGIINSTILGRNWRKPDSETQQQLREDIAYIFRANFGIQCVLLSEFGQMSPSIDVELRADTGDVLQPSTQEYFEQLVRDINLPNVTVHAMAPYVALIDSTVWKVNKCVPLHDLCIEKKNFAMKLLLQHRKNGAEVGVYNCHIPTPKAKNAKTLVNRKKHSAKHSS